MTILATPTATRLRYSEIEVSPAYAQEILDGSKTVNRSISDATVARYARDMVNGDWQFDGSPIQRTRGGDLLNGHHRLLAVIKAGVTVRFTFIDDVPAEAFSTIDIGRKRSGSDTLTIAGFTSSSHTATTMVYLHHFLAFGDLRNPNFDPSRPEILRRIGQLGEDRIARSVAIGQKVHRMLGVSPSFAAAMHIYLSIFSLDKANFFFETLAMGDGLYPGNPVRTLRNYLLNHRLVKSRSNLRQALYATMVAWNSYRRARPLERIAYSVTKDIPKPI